MQNQPHIYILTNRPSGTLYIGVTSNLLQRVHQHRKNQIKGFTAKYNINKLVYFEETKDVTTAISREKEIKKWRREKKNALVEQTNPAWSDLSPDLF